MCDDFRNMKYDQSGEVMTTWKTLQECFKLCASLHVDSASVSLFMIPFQSLLVVMSGYLNTIIMLDIAHCPECILDD
jgi:hypothetical protein